MIYLDCAASTIASKEVRQAMEPWLWGHVGNPSSRHRLGCAASEAIENARHNVLRAFGLSSQGDLVFTSGATEANNLAVLGIARAVKGKGGHIILSPFEHKSVAAMANQLKSEGFSVDTATYNGATGKFNYDKLLKKDTILVAHMLVNNVTGAVFLDDLQDLKKQMQDICPSAYLHADCVQAVGKMDIPMSRIGIDSAVVSGHKIHGPKGVGALLLARRNIPIKSLVYGGGQENGLRPGTENVAAIVGLGEAVANINQNKVELRSKITVLHEMLTTGIRGSSHSFGLLEDTVPEPTKRLFSKEGVYAPTVVGVVVPYAPAETYLNQLQTQNVYIGVGSACQAHENALPASLLALKLNPRDARNTIRVSFSWNTTKEEISGFLDELENCANVLSGKATKRTRKHVSPEVEPAPTETEKMEETLTEIPTGTHEKKQTDSPLEKKPRIEQEPVDHDMKPERSFTKKPNDASADAIRKKMPKSNGVPYKFPLELERPQNGTESECATGTCKIAKTYDIDLKPLPKFHPTPVGYKPYDEEILPGLTDDDGPTMVLVREGEHVLKANKGARTGSKLSANYIRFREALIGSLKAAAADVGIKITIPKKVFGYLFVKPVESALPEGMTMFEATQRLTRRFRDVMGSFSISPVWVEDPLKAKNFDLEPVEKRMAVILGSILAQPENRDRKGILRVKVETKRTNKNLPLNSPQITARLENFLVRQFPDRIERGGFKNSDITLKVEMRQDETIYNGGTFKSIGGMPYASCGKGLCLLSGGLDSPVAAFNMMKRGMAVDFVSFHSYPYLGEQSKQKLASLVQQLTRFQPGARLWLVPFTDCQRAIKDHCDESYRTILYRRMMQRIASKIAHVDGHSCTITGECLGQVASQTIENMTCVEQASGVPVLRPLVGMDKVTVMDTARDIGTYDISIIPEPDCCVVFQPKGPVISGKIFDCLTEEAKIDVDGLVHDALVGSRAFTYPTPFGEIENALLLPKEEQKKTFLGDVEKGLCTTCHIPYFKEKKTAASHLGGGVHKRRTDGFAYPADTNEVNAEKAKAKKLAKLEAAKRQAAETEV